MDICNVKEKGGEIKEGVEVENMYEIGYGELECYKGLERLGEYGMDIKSSKNECVMKRIICEVVEELMEGYECSCNINDIVEKKGWNRNLYREIEEIEIMKNVENGNEEEGDGIGLLL